MVRCSSRILVVIGILWGGISWVRADEPTATAAASGPAAETQPAATAPAATLPAIPDVLADSSYGVLLTEPGEAVAIWTAESARKIGRNRPAPTLRGDGVVRLSAGRREGEAVQVVVRPERDLAGLRVRCDGLHGPGDVRIAADRIELLRVAYVQVQTPTDEWGRAGDWPDPLPPWTGGVDVPAGTNQPIWVLVNVPADAAAGEYSGDLRLEAAGWSAEVPLRVRVWDFTLPVKPHTASAFGLYEGAISRYHAVTDPDARRVLWGKYMDLLTSRRISTYNPAPFDPIEINFVPDADPPRAEVNFERFDAAMTEAMQRWCVTAFTVTLPGIGGGSFHSRHAGEIAGHAAGTPAYEAMFASMAGQIRDHLQQRGWLDKAYIYWFDEPEPKDYAFVREVNERVGRVAPGLRRMLTEEPIAELVGCVDLWCPMTSSYQHEQAELRRAAGEPFWWYVCTIPKAPYATLFIDHPATALRAWCWQSWKYRVEGLLIWTINHWTSEAAFPDRLQNPYVDPMSYVSGYSTEAGTVRHWGNGDGRLIYPPESAAGGATAPVMDPPVSSLRLEVLRDGIDDLDYLYMLQQAIADAPASTPPGLLEGARWLLEVPPEITADLTHFTFNPRPIEARRLAIAAMLERLVAR